MPRYKYVALNMSGQKIEGVHDGKDESSVITMLKERAYFPSSIEKISDGERKAWNIELFSKVNVKLISVFCRQMAAVLGAGVPLLRSLEMMKEETADKNLKKVIIDVIEKITSGMSFSQALKLHGKKLPKLLVSTVAAGEVSGTLEIAFQRMSVTFEKDVKLKNKVKSAMIYPIIVVVVTIIVVSGLLIFVVPQFVGIFESMDMELPFITQSLINVSTFFTSNILYILIFVGVLAFVMKILTSTPRGKLIIDKLKLTLPVIGKLNKKVIAARFTRTFSTLIAAGVSMTSAVSTAGNAINNHYVEKMLNHVATDINRGVSFGEALDDIKVFPNMVVNMAKIGEESGTLEELLDNSADFFDEESSEATARMTAMMEPMIIVLLAGIIMYVVIALLLPMFTMYGGIT